MPERLHSFPTLYALIGKGAEGGKEFARVADLLLLADARQRGSVFHNLNDMSGDFRGLDSFEDAAHNADTTVGYQYKFFPSPLSSRHRTEITAALRKSAAYSEELKLKRWVLVTPEDLVETSGTNAGDVTWFRGLRATLGLTFEIEHYGHTKLQHLFTNSEFLSLRYYPDLLPNGKPRLKTLQDLKLKYDRCITAYLREVKFVGMSVLNEDAAKPVPLDAIYIPLRIVSESSHVDSDGQRSINPTGLVESSRNFVFLGDPGSGKSTLLRALALIEHSPKLRSRYKCKAHERLPIFLILRRYADELRANPGLSLSDYVVSTARSDYNLQAINSDFFEYYLESGQALVLFDGLDELPNPALKEIIRDRIRTFVSSYPGNTVIVSSRVVGYDAPHRFDEAEFKHYRIARLTLPEIERFITDWYTVRKISKRDRDDSVSSLVKLLGDEAYASIRYLAENPLLLTIIALVHRVGQSLPDQRVMLYQKCTETLLTSWHLSKQSASENKVQGKQERLNQRRIEAIAFWLHERAGTTGADQRAVVPLTELLHFLTEHIRTHEFRHQAESDPEDLAAEFLEFARVRAGLLIEVGDQQYSFVHLTFQEYLASCHIVTKSERDGVSQAWSMIAEHVDDPRWNEVVRLLVGSLRDYDTQAVLLERLMSRNRAAAHVHLPILLGGLLLDGVEPAEAAALQIITSVLAAASMERDEGRLRTLLRMMRGFIERALISALQSCELFTSVWRDSAESNRFNLMLIASALTWPPLNCMELLNRMPVESAQIDAFRYFFEGDVRLEDVASMQSSAVAAWRTLTLACAESPSLNALGAAAEHMLSWTPSEAIAKRQLAQLISMMFVGTLPLSDYLGNALRFNRTQIASIFGSVVALPDYATHREQLDGRQGRRIASHRLRSRESEWEKMAAFVRILDRTVDATERSHDLAEFKGVSRTSALRSSAALALSDESTNPDADIEVLRQVLPTMLVELFHLEPRIHWMEALATKVVTGFGVIETPLCTELFSDIDKRILSHKLDGEAEYQATFLLLFGIATLTHYGVSPKLETWLRSRTKATRKTGSPLFAIPWLLFQFAIEGRPLEEVREELDALTQDAKVQSVLAETMSLYNIRRARDRSVDESVNSQSTLKPEQRKQRSGGSRRPR